MHPLWPSCGPSCHPVCAEDSNWLWWAILCYDTHSLIWNVFAAPQILLQNESHFSSLINKSHHWWSLCWEQMWWWKTHSRTTVLVGDNRNPEVPSIGRAVLGLGSWGFGGTKREPHHQRGVGSGRVFQRSVVQLGRTSTSLSKREGDCWWGPWKHNGLHGFVFPNPNPTIK